MFGEIDDASTAQTIGGISVAVDERGSQETLTAVVILCGIAAPAICCCCAAWLRRQKKRRASRRVSLRKMPLVPEPIPGVKLTLSRSVLETVEDGPFLRIAGPQPYKALSQTASQASTKVGLQVSRGALLMSEMSVVEHAIVVEAEVATAAKMQSHVQQATEEKRQLAIRRQVIPTCEEGPSGPPETCSA